MLSTGVTSYADGEAGYRGGDVLAAAAGGAGGAAEAAPDWRQANVALRAALRGTHLLFSFITVCDPRSDTAVNQLPLCRPHICVSSQSVILCPLQNSCFLPMWSISGGVTWASFYAVQARAAAAGSKSVDADGDTDMDGDVAMEVAMEEGAAEQSGALCTLTPPLGHI